MKNQGVFTALAMSVLLSGSFSAYATLGEPLERMEADFFPSRPALPVLGAVSSASSELTFHHQEPHLLVTQHVLAGRVVAVSWSGSHLPSSDFLLPLLGSYKRSYDQLFAKRLQLPRLGKKSHLRLEQDNLILETSGHLGALAGRIYLKNAAALSSTPSLGGGVTPRLEKE